MHSVCRCSFPVWRSSFLKKGTPRDLFLPRPGSAPGGIWPKNNNTCKGPWVLHAYQVSSKSIKRIWRRSRKCEKFTDDGRCAMTIAHSSLRLGWAKNKLFSKLLIILAFYKIIFIFLYLNISLKFVFLFTYSVPFYLIKFIYMHVHVFDIQKRNIG